MNRVRVPYKSRFGLYGVGRFGSPGFSGLGCASCQVPYPYQPTRLGTLGYNVQSGASLIGSGAAAGQALIPIPGVGAAIGAVGGAIASLFSGGANLAQVQADVNKRVQTFQQWQALNGTVPGRQIGLDNMIQIWMGAAHSGHFPNWNGHEQDITYSAKGCSNCHNTMPVMWGLAKTGAPCMNGNTPCGSGTSGRPVRDAKTFVDYYWLPANSPPAWNNTMWSTGDSVGKAVIYDTADAFLVGVDPSTTPYIANPQVAQAAPAPAPVPVVISTPTPAPTPTPTPIAAVPQNVGQTSTPQNPVSIVFMGSTFTWGQNPDSFGNLNVLRNGNDSPTAGGSAISRGLRLVIDTSGGLDLLQINGDVYTWSTMGAWQFVGNLSNPSIAAKFPAGTTSVTAVTPNAPAVVSTGSTTVTTQQVTPAQATTATTTSTTSTPTVVATTSTGTSITSDQLNSLIAQLQTQGASQQQAYTAALQALQSAGAQITPQVQQQVATAAATPQTVSSTPSSGVLIAGAVGLGLVLWMMNRRRHA